MPSGAKDGSSDEMNSWLPGGDGGSNGVVSFDAFEELRVERTVVMISWSRGDQGGKEL